MLYFALMWWQHLLTIREELRHVRIPIWTHLTKPTRSCRLSYANQGIPRPAAVRIKGADKHAAAWRIMPWALMIGPVQVTASWQACTGEFLLGSKHVQVDQYSQDILSLRGLLSLEGRLRTSCEYWWPWTCLDPSEGLLKRALKEYVTVLGQS